MTVRVRHGRPALALLGLLILAGCGRQTTEPESTRVVSPTQKIGPLVQSDNWEHDVLLAVIRPGEDATAVSGDHGCLVDDELDDQLSVRLAFPSGTDLVAREAELAADPRVAGVSRSFLAQNSESRQSSMAFDEGNQVPEYFHDQEAFNRIDLPEAIMAVRRLGSQPGGGVPVAIIDTGAFTRHRELIGKVSAASYDFIDEDNQPLDLPDGADNDGDGLTDEAAGHGTHVAGLVAAGTPDSPLLILRVLDSDGVGTAYNVARAIEYATLHGARVINLSLGMLEEVPVVDEALSFADNHGVVVIASAGNWGSSVIEEYPASAHRVWAIAASDSLDNAASFTSYFQDVALSAPGTGIRSAFWNGGYAIWSGTSMSAPLVTAGAALLLFVHPTWTRDQALARLQAYVDPVVATSNDQVGRLGSGRLNLGRALAVDLPPAQTQRPDRGDPRKGPPPEMAVPANR